MQKEQIEAESKNVAEYFEKYWTSYVDPYFDRTFSLRNWTTISAALILHHNKYKSNNNNYEKNLKSIFKNKKILHIGCGYGYFLEVVKNLNGIPYGIEPYCSFPENLGIIKAKVESLQKNKSEFKREKFDVIVAHDFFLSSIITNKDNAHKIIKSLKKYLKGIMIFEIMNEEPLLEKEKIEKYGFKVENINNITNPYGYICNQFIIK